MTKGKGRIIYRDHRSEKGGARRLDVTELVERLAAAEGTLQTVVASEEQGPDDEDQEGVILLQQAQEALQKYAGRYQRLFSRMAAVIFELDPQGTILEVNEAIQPLTGYSPAELIGQNWWDVFCPEQPDEQAGELPELLRVSDVSNYELKIRTRSGGELILELNTGNYYSEAGALERIVGFGLDITARKQAEERIQRKQLQLAYAQQEAQIGSWIWELNSDTITWSDDLFRIFGVTRGEFEPSYAGWLESIHPEDRARADNLVKAALISHKPFTFEHRILRPDGQVRFIRGRGEVFLDEHGRPARLVGTAQDVTARVEVEHTLEQINVSLQQANDNLEQRVGERTAALKKANRQLKEINLRLEETNRQLGLANQRLQTVLQYLPVAVLIADAAGRIIEKNGMVDQLWGGEALMPERIEQYGEYKGWWAETGEPLGAEDWALARAVLHGEISVGEVIDIERFDGSRGTILNSSVPFYDAQGEITGAVAVSQDITHQRQLEQAAHRAAGEALRRAEELAAVFTAMADAVIVFDAAGVVQEANPAAVESFGFNPVGLNNLQLAKKVQLCYPDERRVPTEELPSSRALRGEKSTEVRLLLTNVSGELRSVTVSASPLQAADTSTAGVVVLWRDITEREQLMEQIARVRDELEVRVQERTQELAKANAELVESEARFRLVIESIKDYAIFVLDPDGYITSWNAGAEAIKGYRAEEVIGKHYSLFYPPEQVEINVPQIILERAAQVGRFETEGWRVRKDGSRFWANVVITALRDENGQLRGFAKVTRDMTRRKQSDEALRRQTGFVRLLQEIAVAANQAVSVEQVMQFAMERICKHTGWVAGHWFNLAADGSGELVSMQRWHSADLSAFDEFLQATRVQRYRVGEGIPGQVLASGDPLWVQDVTRMPGYRRKEEALRSGIRTCVAVPVLVGEQVVAVLEFYAQNISPPDVPLLNVLAHIGTQLGRVVERKRSERALVESEARFRTIFEGAPMGIELIDLDGRMLAYNPAISRILGYAKEDLWREASSNNRSLVNIVTARPPKTEYFTHDPLTTPLKAAANRLDMLFEQLRSGKRDSYHLERPYLRKDGQIVWGRLSVSLVRDSDGAPQYAIGILEDETERKQMEADLADLKRRQIEGREAERLHLSQELHDGPLQDLIGLTFHMKAFSDLLPETVDIRPVQEIQANIQQVVRTLRTICGDLRPPTLAPFGLEKAIRSHAEDFQDLHPEIMMGLDLMPDGQLLPEKVRLALFRVYQQALMNVLRHAHARHVLIRLALTEDEVLLEVTDDGKGFTMPGRWIDLARKGHLGLVGVSERVEAIGGQLNVESEEGKGTRLWVTVSLHGQLN